MKKSLLFFVFYAVAFLVLIVNSVYMIVDNVVLDINSVPNGEYKFSSLSPDKNTELKVYSVETEIGNSVRVEILSDEKTENVFWQANESSANIYWQNNNVVIINGIIIDISKGETFDSRSAGSIFNDGLMGWRK